MGENVMQKLIARNYITPDGAKKYGECIQTIYSSVVRWDNSLIKRSPDGDKRVFNFWVSKTSIKDFNNAMQGLGMELKYFQKDEVNPACYGFMEEEYPELARVIKGCCEIKQQEQQNIIAQSRECRG